MEKVYVKFGDIQKTDINISVFEAVLEGNVVKIILPTSLYTTLQSLARHMDEPAFIVMGDIVGKGKDGEPLMSNPKVKIPLKFDKYIETYVCEERIPIRRERKGNLNLPQWYRH